MVRSHVAFVAVAIAVAVASAAHGADFTLTVTKLGDGSGTITSSPPGISCGDSVGVQNCSKSFSTGSTITLSAAFNAPNVFNGWVNLSGSAVTCVGTGPCTFALTQNTNVSALINRLKFRVQYRATGTAPPGQSAGAIKMNGHPCLANLQPCEQLVSALSTVSVEAVPGGTTRLKSMLTPCGSPTNGKCSFQLTQDTNLLADFELLPVSTLTIGTLGNANGKVGAASLTLGVIPNISCHRDDKDTVGSCTSSMPSGTVIKLTATPEKNLITQPLPDFKGWFEGTGAAAVCNGKTTTTCQFTLSANSSVKAKFCRAVVGCLAQ